MTAISSRVSEDHSLPDITADIWASASLGSGPS
jgi:hypothetical protein